MQLQRLMIGLTVINMVLLVFLLTQIQRTSAPESAPVLRVRALHIVDDQDRVRAEIVVHGPEQVGETLYPETVLFRLIDPKRGPIVKLTASENGSAFRLSDDSEGGVQLYARDTGNFMKVVDPDGHEQVITP